ncbi:hypothetical protein CVT26_000024 [Gymnopilus dilepis]|uniref:Nucleoside diphosphate kinase n=1 Tax=Gymnopilus dilepis TaxID=231916 RepID=A0A409VGL3_9AGAR|nr:hypothetical protein CVT26_000024 [Gymnopilus dilepis]
MSTPPPDTPETQYDSEVDQHHHEEAEFDHEHEHELLQGELGEEEGNRTPHISSSTSSVGTITRTVAIIKPHALAHRFDIERRIQEASFEIVKERQMEFDVETDPDTLYELFGQDADALAEGPVWVYVLERRRAVEVWNTLMGDPNIDIARRESPNSLRALYGISTEQNGLMGSPDAHTAEIQIQALFASSPPFPTTELPPEDGRYGSMRSIDSNVLDEIRQSLANGGEDEGYAPSSVTNPSTTGGSGRAKFNANGKIGFKARPLPVTHDKPDIVPRTTRAAALRAGQPVESIKVAPRAPLTKERLAQTFANVPGHKRSSTITVASTAAPTIAPRMTRAASLRLGQAPAPPPIKKRSVTEGERTKHGLASTFEGVPGHKRRESIAVASVKAPTVAPRLNKSAALRQQKEQAPPSSFMFRSGSAAKTPTLSRTSSNLSSSGGSPSKAPPPRPASQASVKTPTAPTSRYAVPRASSVAAVRPKTADSKLSNGHALEGSTTSSNGGTGAATPAAAKPKPRPSSIGAPTIAPRTNKSAALRQAKKEAEAAAAAAAAAKKGPRPSVKAPPPSSFKAVPAV